MIRYNWNNLPFENLSTAEQCVWYIENLSDTSPATYLIPLRLLRADVKLRLRNNSECQDKVTYKRFIEWMDNVFDLHGFEVSTFTLRVNH